MTAFVERLGALVGADARQRDLLEGSAASASPSSPSSAARSTPPSPPTPAT